MQTNQQVRKDIGLFSALCLLYVIVMAMVGLIYQTIVTLFQASHYFGNLEKIQKATENFMARDGSYYLIAVCAGVFIFWVYRDGKLFKSDLRMQKRAMTSKTFGIVLSFLLLGQLGFVLFNQIFETIFNLFGFTMLKAVESASAGSDSVSMFLYASFFGPVSEELIFRGAGLRTFEKYGRIFAILMSSLLFGLFHGNFPQFFFATFVGIIFSYVTLEYSILWAMAFHIFNNLVIGDGLTYVYSFLPDSAASLLYLIILLIGASIAAIFLFKNKTDIKRYVRENCAYPGAYRQAFRSVWFWLFACLMCLTSLTLIRHL
ncbi:CPBP family intramembrane metalloprotease [Streptococcus intermedius]|uniref:CPBP family intramembrane glutamic endopeptidase n=1 Tax=Streptococcus intermedius TaxID=1338 RepID=UPI0025565DAA|nr:CPBP family intramembrane metalloprotease [Streptococcus intermedius]MDK8090536.1 CPBP family intramembrane metalloprotease [Streptococcus intermedius]